MKEDKFLIKLRKKIPELVYSNSLLDSESIEIPIYFGVDNNGEVKVDFESIRRELEEKINVIVGCLR
jgi:hypothetical protein